MIQAEIRSSTGERVSSAGKNRKMSPRPVTGKILPRHGDFFNSESLAALTGSDGDRLIEVGHRSMDLKRLLDVLACEDSLDMTQRALLSVAMREVDMIATIAIQPYVTVERII